MIENTSPGKYARAKQAAQHLGLGESTLWALLKRDSSFPQPVRLGLRTTLFSLNELDEWMRSKRGARAAS